MSGKKKFATEKPLLSTTQGIKCELSRNILDKHPVIQLKLVFPKDSLSVAPEKYRLTFSFVRCSNIQLSGELIYFGGKNFSQWNWSTRNGRFQRKDGKVLVTYHIPLSSRDPGHIFWKTPAFILDMKIAGKPVDLPYVGKPPKFNLNHGYGKTSVRLHSGFRNYSDTIRSVVRGGAVNPR